MTLKITCADDGKEIDIDDDFLKILDVPELEEEIEGLGNVAPIELPVHSEAIVWIKQWSKNSDYPIKLEHVARVAKAANYLGTEVLYRTALKTIAEHLTIERILRWGSDLASMGGVNLPLLDFLLAEQPSIELFNHLTTGDQPILVLNDSDKDKYAAQFAAFKASWKTVRSANKGNLRALKVGFCGRWQSCYALLWNSDTYKRSLVSYDLDKDRWWEKEDVLSACYACLGTDTHVLFSIPGHITDEQTAVNLETMEITSVGSGQDLWSEPIPTSGYIAASSMSVTTLGWRDTTANQRWVCIYDNGHHHFKESAAPHGDLEKVEISRDGDLEILAHHRSVSIRNVKYHPERLVEIAFLPGSSAPESFDFSPDSKAFIASNSYSVWVGDIGHLHTGALDPYDSPINCVHLDIRTWLDKHDHIADAKYSPDGSCIAIVSRWGRMLIFETVGKLVEPFLVYDDLLNRNFGMCDSEFKDVTCADWSQAELILTGTAFGSIPVPIGSAIRKARMQIHHPCMNLNYHSELEI